MMEHSDVAEALAMRAGCPARHPSPKKSPARRMPITTSFPWRETRLSEHY
jgi:hypothetical protein